MRVRLHTFLTATLLLSIIFFTGFSYAQDVDEDKAAQDNDEAAEKPIEEEILNPPPIAGTTDEEEAEAPPEPEGPAAEREEVEETAREVEETVKKEAAEGGEQAIARRIKIAGIIIMNYVFEDSPNAFVVKYRIDMSGETFADTAVIRGDVDLGADVDGSLWKFPTGECKLDISIPKVPFEISFRKTGEDKGSLQLIFKKAITEDWKSRCTFQDAPGASFDTTGPPEKWLERALQKARPPLKSIVVDLKNEETTMPLVISKEIIGDPPIGSMEIEGTLSTTVSPGD